MTAPTRIGLCPTCKGEGRVTVFDVAAMKAARLKAGLTQSALARAAGWAANQLSEIESGVRPMTAASAERYWMGLRAAVGERRWFELIGGAEEENTHEESRPDRAESRASRYTREDGSDR